MTARLADPKPVGARGVMNYERAAKVAAKRLGITSEEYLSRRASGERWCSGCQAWHRLDRFPPDKTSRDGCRGICREAHRLRYGTTQDVISLDAADPELRGIELEWNTQRSVFIELIDPSTEINVIEAENCERLRVIVGDMEPEDVRFLDSDSLARLQDKLREEGLVPRGVLQRERERLSEPNRHAGSSVPKMGRKHGGRRTRKQQQQVTHAHHVRELPNAAKKAHKQRRQYRQDEAA